MIVIMFTHEQAVESLWNLYLPDSLYDVGCSLLALNDIYKIK